MAWIDSLGTCVGHRRGARSAPAVGRFGAPVEDTDWCRLRSKGQWWSPASSPVLVSLPWLLRGWCSILLRLSQLRRWIRLVAEPCLPLPCDASLAHSPRNTLLPTLQLLLDQNHERACVHQEECIKMSVGPPKSNTRQAARALSARILADSRREPYAGVG